MCSCSWKSGLARTVIQFVIASSVFISLPFLFSHAPLFFIGFLAILGRHILLFDASLVLLCNFLLLLFDTEVSIGSQYFWNRCRVLAALLSNDVDDRWSF